MKKLISWNVNGLRAVLGKNFMEDFQKLDAEKVTAKVLQSDGTWKDLKEDTDFTVEREKGNIEGVTETVVETDSARMYFDTETKKFRNYVNKKDKYVDSSGFTNEQVSQIATQIVSNLDLSSMVSDISKYSLDKVENFNNEIWVVTFTKKENKDSQIIIGLCPATKELVSLTISE